MPADTVPFGKYKGRPVEDMLSDADYMSWLEAQPWFRERFAHLLSRRDEEAASRTPVHNRLQALFLDSAYCMAFAVVAAPDAFARFHRLFAKSQHDDVRSVSEEIDRLHKCWQRDIENAARFREYHAEGQEFLKPRYNCKGSNWLELAAEYEQEPKQLAVLREALSMLQAQKPQILAQARFEHDGSDVALKLSAGWKTVATYSASNFTELHAAEESHLLRIEIKPVVADDYPAVLRQMNRNKSDYLFVDHYNGEGATEDQFVRIFQASGKRVVFKRMVDAEWERSAS